MTPVLHQDENGYINDVEIDKFISLFFDGFWLRKDDPRMKQFKDKEDMADKIRSKCDQVGT